jgi:GxxExxY protein
MARAKSAKHAKDNGEKEDHLAKIIVHAAFDLRKEAGPGLLESVYEVLLADMLREQNLAVERQKPIPINFLSGKKI